ncbi:MAG: hypothetical protein AAF711_00465 [Planctomycetota bacterium]
MIDWLHITLYLMGFFLAIPLGVDAYSKKDASQSTVQIMTIMFAVLWPLFAVFTAIQVVRKSPAMNRSK